MDVKENKELHERYKDLRAMDQKLPHDTWLVEHETSGQLFVRKEVLKDSLPLFHKLQTLSNPHLVKIEAVYEMGEKGFVIEPYVGGKTLSTILDEQTTLEEATAISYTLQILDALETIHRAGIIHRDISPNNLLISTDGVLKLLDFGISRIPDDSKGKDTHILGTYGYAAPEQFGYRQTDARSDLYAVGAVLYRMLYGMLPSEGKFQAKASPVGLVMQKAMRMEPQERYESAAQMRQALLQDKSNNRLNAYNKDQNADLAAGVENNQPRVWIPGFRTGKTWKQIVAVVGYVMMLLSTLSYWSQTLPNKEHSFFGNVIGTFLLLWVAPLEVFDLFYWSRKMPGCKHLSKGMRLFIRILLFVVIFFVSFLLIDPVS